MPLTKQQEQALVQAVWAEPELYGCIVGYYGDNQSRVLNEGLSPSVNWARVVVVIEEAPPPVDTGLGEATAGPTVVENPALPQANESKITSELIGTGLSCGMAVLSGVGVAGGVVLEAPSAGTSTFLLVMAWGGLITSGAQCVNGIVRSAEAIINPESDSLYRWDQNEVYSTTFLIVDGLGIAFGLAALPAQGKNLLRVLQRRGALTSADEFAKLAPAQRKVAIQKAVEEASRTDAGRKELLAAMRDAGLKPNQVANAVGHGTKSVRQGTKVLGAISKDAAKRVHGEISSALQTFVGIGVSATPSAMTGSGSGAANALIVHVSELR